MGGAHLKSSGQVMPEKTLFVPPNPSSTWLGLFGSVIQLVPSRTNLYWKSVAHDTSKLAFQSAPSFTIGTPLVQPSGLNEPRSSTDCSPMSGYVISAAQSLSAPSHIGGGGSLPPTPVPVWP